MTLKKLFVLFSIALHGFAFGQRSKETILEFKNSIDQNTRALHELINKMLNKESGLTYEIVRERYEHFRARCLTNPNHSYPYIKNKMNGENGCTEPLYGEKSKCILKIVPDKNKCETLQIDKKCIKYKINSNYIM